jgi:hypothetical protein
MFIMVIGIALLVWAIVALTRSGTPKAPKTIQRIVKAPDGRTATFTVPVDEPASVTIARMYRSRRESG